jgi:hypothetical protein
MNNTARKGPDWTKYVVPASSMPNFFTTITIFLFGEL